MREIGSSGASAAVQDEGSQVKQSLGRDAAALLDRQGMMSWLEFDERPLPGWTVVEHRLELACRGTSAMSGTARRRRGVRCLAGWCGSSVGT
jgi:hypothetical protein